MVSPQILLVTKIIVITLFTSIPCWKKGASLEAIRQQRPHLPLVLVSLRQHGQRTQSCRMIGMKDFRSYLVQWSSNYLW